MINSGTISKIIGSNLLAASASKLAAALGYAGRTTINRLRTETAGQDATEEFCKRLIDVAGVHEDDIETVGRMIDLTDELTSQIQREYGELSEATRFRIVCSFIDDDYSLFSDSFRELELNKWLLLKGHEREMFFYVLALFLLHDNSKSFYKRNIDTEERYKGVLEPVQKILEEKYPKHSIGNGISTGLLDAPLARLAYPCFLTAIRLCGILLQGYVSNYSDANNHELIIKIPGLPERSFWDEGEDRNIVTFLKYIPVNDKGNGLYEHFQYNIQTGKTENFGHLYFYGEKNMGLFLKKERSLFFGHYSFDGNHLHLVLKPRRDKTFKYSWKRLTTDASQRVREIDRLFTESYLNNVMYESLGLEVSCGVMISEVALTKSKITLQALDGSKYSISRNLYPWLKDVTPDIIPMAYKDRSDNKIYIEWQQLGCRIALDEFTKK